MRCEDCKHFESCLIEFFPCSDYDKDSYEELDEVDIHDYIGEEDYDEWSEHEDWEFE